MTKKYTAAEYVVEVAPRLYGLPRFVYVSPDDPRVKPGFASQYYRELDGWTDKAIAVIKDIKKKNASLKQEEHTLLKQIPALQEQARLAKLEASRKRCSIEMADCLRRFDALDIKAEDPTFALRFTFEHALDICRKYIHEIYDGPIDVNSVICDPSYLDELIMKNPDAVHVRGFLYLVAEGAYEQHTQSVDVFKTIANNPHLSEEQVKFLLVHQVDVDNNTFVDKRMRFYVWALKKIKNEGLFIDEQTNGHHMNYFMLPNMNLHNQIIREFGVDRDGNFYTPEEAKAYLSSLKSRPMLETDFGYKKLIRLTDPFIRHQEKIGKVMTTKRIFRNEDIVEKYEELTAPSM